MKRETYLDFKGFLEEHCQASAPLAGPPPTGAYGQDCADAAIAKYTKGGGFMVSRLNRAMDNLFDNINSADGQGILASTSEEAFDNACITVGKLLYESSEIDYCITQLGKRNVFEGVHGDRVANLVPSAHTISHAWNVAKSWCDKPYSEHTALSLKFRMMGGRLISESARNTIDHTIADANAQGSIRLLRPKYTD